MASVPSSSPPPPSPPSASNSDNSATSPTASLTPTNSLQLDGDGATTNNGPLNVDDKKPDLPDLFNTDYSEKYKKYEADYTFRLMAKYFSKRNLYGGNIFDVNTTIDDEIIKSSRWPCTRSYADPVQGFEDQSSSSSAYSDETPTEISNGKVPVKKNS
ncbi:LOC110794626 isoform [Fagus crenata]